MEDADLPSLLLTMTGIECLAAAKRWTLASMCQLHIVIRFSVWVAGRESASRGGAYVAFTYTNEE